MHISGARLIGVDGRPLRLIGVNRSGTEYACAGPVDGGGFGYGIFQGPADDRSIRAMLTWDINAVALPLNEACWLGGYANLDPRYSGRAVPAAPSLSTSTAGDFRDLCRPAPFRLSPRRPGVRIEHDEQ